MSIISIIHQMEKKLTSVKDGKAKISAEAKHSANSDPTR